MASGNDAVSTLMKGIGYLGTIGQRTASPEQKAKVSLKMRLKDPDKEMNDAYLNEFETRVNRYRRQKGK